MEAVDAQDIPKKKHDALLDACKLDDQESLFICTMESNAKKVMEGDIKSINPLTLATCSGMDCRNTSSLPKLLQFLFWEAWKMRGPSQHYHS